MYIQNFQILASLAVWVLPGRKQTPEVIFSHDVTQLYSDVQKLQ